MRARAASLGLTLDRLGLEDFGEAIVRTRGYLSALNDLLEASGEDDLSHVLVDGVRHSGMLEAIRNVYQDVTSAFFEVPAFVRYARWLRREALCDSEESRRTFELLATAPVERHVSDLQRLADVVLNGTQPVDLLAQKLVTLATIGNDN
jgi:hypothetical protein